MNGFLRCYVIDGKATVIIPLDPGQSVIGLAFGCEPRVLPLPEASISLTIDASAPDEPLHAGLPVVVAVVRNQDVGLYLNANEAQLDAIMHHAIGNAHEKGPGGDLLQSKPGWEETQTLHASDVPGYWMHETSGVLRPAITAYLNQEPLTPQHVAAMRAYLRQWVNAPGWRGEAVVRLRKRVDGLTSEAAIRSWLRAAEEADIDPL